MIDERRRSLMARVVLNGGAQNCNGLAWLWYEWNIRSIQDLSDNLQIICPSDCPSNHDRGVQFRPRFPRNTIRRARSRLARSNGHLLKFPGLRGLSLRAGDNGVLGLGKLFPLVFT